MDGKIFSKRLFLLGLAFMLTHLPLVKAAEYQVESGGNQTDIFYSSSYALVIGIENYKEKDWPSQVNAVNDAVLVGNELEKQGFDVTYRIDLDLIGLENTIRRFFNNVNIDNNSRLFIWYSGHGHTIAGEGFLVPADAPSKNDPKLLKTKTFPVKHLYELSRITKARYVYMVFDSCLSSADFIEENIDKSTMPLASILKYPSRQYLCSCSAGKTKIEDNVFRETFIKSIRNEVAVDADGDNYITASEIGKVIKNKMEMSAEGRKHEPHYGRLKDFEQGEFVFLPPGKFHGYFRDSLKEGSRGPEMIKIPGGSFMMGDLQGDGFEDEKPVHEVKVADIAVSRFEVTFEEYDLFCNKKGGKKPLDNGWGRGKRPVIYISWEDAVAYTKWLHEQTGYIYRLPTEAEWEYFARAGTKTNYWWGNDIKYGNANCEGCIANWSGNSERKTNIVGLFMENPFGIYDTVGNVWEWTCSEYTDEYNDSMKETKRLEKITTGGEVVVLRGGAWDEKPKNCRVSHRKVGYPGERSQYIGFRVVRELK